MSESPSASDEQATRQLLRSLALDLRWSWNHAADEVWNRIDPELWSRTHNPWIVLQTVSRPRLSALLADAPFRTQIQQLDRAASEAMEAPAWFQQTDRSSALSRVAYFSMEFMLSEALPIYAGDSAMWREISSRQRAIWVYRSLASVCCTSRVIFVR